jgi:hypothetical protein
MEDLERKTLPPGWALPALGDISDLVMGQAPASSDTNFDGRGVPFVKTGEFGPKRPFFREWTTRPLKIASTRDILICVVGATIGKLTRAASNVSTATFYRDLQELRCWLRLMGASPCATRTTHRAATVSLRS